MATKHIIFAWFWSKGPDFRHVEVLNNHDLARATNVPLVPWLRSFPLVDGK